MRWSLAEAIERVNIAAWRGQPRPRGFSPSIDARLKVAYVPRLHDPKPSDRQDPGDEFWGHGPRLLGPWPDHGPPGLVGCPQSVHSDVPARRYGLNGLTAKGARRLREGCGVLQETMRRCVLWTITLGDEEHRQLRELDAWPRFQNAIRHRLVRLMKRRGLEALAVAVAELHPGRSGREVQAMAHLHVMFQSLYLGQGRWAITTEDLDGVIASALRAAGVRDFSVQSAGNVERVRKDCAGYLSKYMAKAAGGRSKRPGHVAAANDAFQGDPRGCPRQWWFMTARLQFLCERCRCNMPSAFMAWICDHREEPRPGALVVVQRVEIADPRAPGCWAVRFRSPSALAAMWNRYVSAGRFGEPVNISERTPHGNLHSRKSPKRHQHLRAADRVRRHGVAERGERADGERDPGAGCSADVSGAGVDDRRQHRPVRGVGVRPWTSTRLNDPTAKAWMAAEAVTASAPNAVYGSN